MLGGARFGRAVARQDIKGWPPFVASAEMTEAIQRAGASTDSQIGRVGFSLRHKQRKHPELTAERLRMAQDAYDYGEVLIEPPFGHRGQGDKYTLIAYYFDDGWWRHATDIRPDRLEVKTIFRDADGGARREQVHRRTGLVTVRAWDEARWAGRGR